MNKLVRNSLLGAMLLVAGVGIGCGKKAADSAVAADQAAAPAKLAGSQEAMAALDKKDYEATVAGIMKAKDSVASKDDEAALANLIDDVKVRLIQVAPTDPKAAEALTVVRRLARGR